MLPDKDRNPEQNVPVSPPITTPNANSLNFKAGGFMLVWDALHGRRAGAGSSSMPSRQMQSHRVGHSGNGIAANFRRFLEALGQESDPHSDRDKTLLGLQAAKALGNVAGFTIDYARVPDKGASVRNFAYGARSHGAYSLVDSGAIQEIELTHFKPAPQSRYAQTSEPATGEAHTQTPPPESTGSQTERQDKLPAHTQTQTGSSDKATQTSTSTRAGSSQTGTNGGDIAGNRTTSSSSDEKGTQTHIQLVSEKTQAHSHGQDAETQTQRRETTDAENQAKPKVSHKGVLARVPRQEQSVQTHSSGPVDSSVQTEARVKNSKTQTGADVYDATVQTGSSSKTDTATQTVSSRSSVGTRTATTSHNVQVQTAPSNARELIPQTSASLYDPRKRSPREGIQPTPRHHAGSQTVLPRTDQGSQANVKTQDRNTQSSLPTKEDQSSQTRVFSKDSEIQVTSPSRTRSTQTTQAPHIGVPSFKPQRPAVPSTVKANGHWLVIDAFALASSGSNLKGDPSQMNRLTLASDSISSAGDVAATINLGGNEVLALTGKTLSLLGTAIGLAPSVAQLSSDIKTLIAHPENEQAKWNVGNSAVQLFGGLLATAASFAFPPAALVPLLFPNFAEIGHAEDLRKQEAELRAQGRTAEADVVHGEYVKAALNATPIINWFSSFYTPAMRPAIERFELSHGNKPGSPPRGDLTPGERGDPAVADYYGQAIQQRGQSLAAAATPYLKEVLKGTNADSITFVSRAPQMFGWPSTGQPMRMFDRAIAITYSKKTGLCTFQFFGKDKDGVFRLPILNEGVATDDHQKNIVLMGNQLDPDKQKVKFDLEAYRNAPHGQMIVVDPNNYRLGA
ncbi:hypothetical protein [Paraburkholderia phytofirmans]|uniref:Uncharacterized protein n=1 Tax=Paraburkholderia phytofirmans TaxID=261302 RepID=A0ABW9B8I3_9BURK